MTGFLDYVKKAFLYKWNLLAFGAGTVAGIISGSPDVALPLIFATEIAYLALLSNNHKFQAAIDAAKHKQERLGASQAAKARTLKMLQALSPADRSKYDELKQTCVQLSDIAGSFKGAAGSGDAIGPSRSGGINRLLWIYLKLLTSKAAIERFFQTTNKHQILSDMKTATDRLATLGPEDNDSPNDKRRRASLNDQLKTCEARLENYQRAEGNYEFIQDELSRLFSKIVTLAEMAISRQDPNFITSEVNIVSESVESSEKAMNELDFLTGWSQADETAPDMFAVEDETVETV